MNKTHILYTLSIALIVVAVMIVASSFGGGQKVGYADERMEEFATCIADSGAIFYGAYWCGHCVSQKNDFGSAKKILPYVECATPSGKSQAQACESAGITSYPTWVFGNELQLKGRQTFETLAEMTQCTAPSSEQTI